ncbi:hypothetical protein KB221_14060 [Aquidulcibacter paucihalophilus]|nr:hypothetical protein KB221_14060 [Aquidulcibacter paucihalophilus]
MRSKADGNRATGITPADRLLALYHGEWQGDLTRLYRDFAY